MWLKLSKWDDSTEGCRKLVSHLTAAFHTGKSQTLCFNCRLEISKIKKKNASGSFKLSSTDGILILILIVQLFIRTDFQFSGKKIKSVVSLFHGDDSLLFFVLFNNENIDKLSQSRSVTHNQPYNICVGIIIYDTSDWSWKFASNFLYNILITSTSPIKPKVEEFVHIWFLEMNEHLTASQ